MFDFPFPATFDREMTLVHWDFLAEDLLSLRYWTGWRKQQQLREGRKKINVSRIWDLSPVIYVEALCKLQGSGFQAVIYSKLPEELVKNADFPASL